MDIHMRLSWNCSAAAMLVLREGITALMLAAGAAKPARVELLPAAPAVAQTAVASRASPAAVCSCAAASSPLKRLWRRARQQTLKWGRQWLAYQDRQAWQQGVLPRCPAHCVLPLLLQLLPHYCALHWCCCCHLTYNTVHCSCTALLLQSTSAVAARTERSAAALHPFLAAADPTGSRLARGVGPGRRGGACHVQARRIH